MSQDEHISYSEARGGCACVRTRHKTSIKVLLLLPILPVVALVLKIHTPLLQKRPRGTSTFQTPIRPSKRLPRRELKLLRKNSPAVTAMWSEDEIKALVEAVLLNCRGDYWPAYQRMAIWDSVTSFVRMRAAAPHQRSGQCTFLFVLYCI